MKDNCTDPCSPHNPSQTNDSLTANLQETTLRNRKINNLILHTKSEAMTSQIQEN